MEEKQINIKNNKNGKQGAETMILENLFTTFRIGLLTARTGEARECLTNLGFNYNQMEIGFNSGQFHHGKDEAFKQPYLEMGLLIETEGKGNAPDRKPCKIFAKNSIVFPLRNIKGDMVNIYGYRFNLKEPVGEYLNDTGVYPQIPHEQTTKLYICFDVLSTASLVNSKVMENRDACLSLLDGKLNSDTIKAIKGLGSLEEIICIGCYTKVIAEQLNKVFSGSILNINLTEGYSLNRLYSEYGSNAISQILEQDVKEVDGPSLNELVVVSETEFEYKGDELSYVITGLVSSNPTHFEMQFCITELKTDKRVRLGLNLLDSQQVKEELYVLTDDMDINFSNLLLEIETITQELEALRRKKEDGYALTEKGFSVKANNKAKAILKSKDMFKEINAFIGDSGVVGEEKTRMLLYTIAGSYKFDYNLHGVVQAQNPALGSELVSKIATLIPEIDQYHIDQTSTRSFRYFGNDTINNKLIVIPDYVGVIQSKAITDLKRLQSKGTIFTDVPKKSPNGELHTVKQEVQSHSSSIGACNNSKRFFENEPRTVLIGMDNSLEQNQRLMEYDCNVMSGTINLKQQENAKEVLQYIVKNLEKRTVINPFASSLMLPSTVVNARVLSMQLMNYTNIVTLFYQHQRKLNKKGELITEKTDVMLAIDLFLDAIMVNIDELDTHTRNFFETLKKLFLEDENKKETVMSSVDIRQALNVSKSGMNRYLKVLLEMEYISKQGHKNTGYNYKITNWYEMDKIKEVLIEKLQVNNSEQ